MKKYVRTSDNIRFPDEDITLRDLMTRMEEHEAQPDAMQDN